MRCANDNYICYIIDYLLYYWLPRNNRRSLRITRFSELKKIIRILLQFTISCLLKSTLGIQKGLVIMCIPVTRHIAVLGKEQL